MARIRSVKPEMATDEDLATCSAWAQLLAVRVLNQCDDEGFFKANPALIKSACFPLVEDESCNATGLLRELAGIGYIRLCAGSDGKAYGQVVKFNDHQVINKPKPSKIKDLCDFTEEYRIDQVPVPTGKERNREGKGTGKGDISAAPSRAGATADQVGEVFEYWCEKLNHPGARLDDKRKAIIRKALKGYSVEDLRDAIDGCAASAWHMGANDRGTRYDALNLIFRDADHIDKFRRLAREGGGNPVGSRARLEQNNAEVAGRAAEAIMEDLDG